MKIRILVAIIAVFNVSVLAQEKALWKAGAATAVITPEKPMRMSGYGARIKPATGKDQDLFGKALAIEDQKGNRVVFITLDLIGVTAKVMAHVVMCEIRKFGFLAGTPYHGLGVIDGDDFLPGRWCAVALDPFQ